MEIDLATRILILTLALCAGVVCKTMAPKLLLWEAFLIGIGCATLVVLAAQAAYAYAVALDPRGISLTGIAIGEIAVLAYLRWRPQKTPRGQ